VHHLVDNDIALKLARLELLKEACQLLGLNPSNTKRLAALPFVAKKVLKGKQDTLKRVLEFCDSYKAISKGDDPEVLAQISASPKIEAGEARLFAIAANDKDIVVLTGDKRSILALASDPKLKAIARKLEGRIEILETIMIRLIAAKTFDFVRQQVLKVLDVDTILALAFDTQESDREGHCRDALTSEESHIHKVHLGLIRRL
jgi:hypothetical protein